MNDGRFWSERIDRVKADPAALEEAAALHFLVTSHLQDCTHKRRCPEETLYDEALSIAGMAKKERAAAAAAAKEGFL